MTDAPPPADHLALNESTPLYGPHSPFRHLPSFTAAQALASQLLLYGLFALALWGLASLRGVPLPPVQASFALGEISWGLGVGLALFILNGLLAVPLQGLPATRPLVYWLMRRNAVIFAHLPPWTLLLMAFLAGWIEEVLFRAWLQPLAGLVIASVLFAYVHFPRSRFRYRHWVTWGMVALYLPTAFALGLLFEARGGDLTAVIVAHWVIDFLGLGVLMLARRGKPDE